MSSEHRTIIVEDRGLEPALPATLGTDPAIERAHRRWFEEVYDMKLIEPNGERSEARQYGEDFLDRRTRLEAGELAEMFPSVREWL